MLPLLVTHIPAQYEVNMSLVPGTKLVNMSLVPGTKLCTSYVRKSIDIISFVFSFVILCGAVFVQQEWTATCQGRTWVVCFLWHPETYTRGYVDSWFKFEYECTNEYSRTTAVVLRIHSYGTWHLEPARARNTLGYHVIVFFELRYDLLIQPKKRGTTKFTFVFYDMRCCSRGTLLVPVE